MDLELRYEADAAASRIAAAIGEQSRARMLYCLMDGHARTSTELAIVAGVNPSTASDHLNRLRSENLVRVVSQGKHRYYSLYDAAVADMLERLSVFASSGSHFTPSTPPALRAARTCYDHMAGELAVELHDRLVSSQWIASAADRGVDYDLTERGASALAKLGVDVAGERAKRRRFAYACLDWSERKPHLAGALGSALLALALRKRWVSQGPDSRMLSVTALGRRALGDVGRNA